METGIGGVLVFLLGVPGIILMILGTLIGLGNRTEGSAQEKERSRKLIYTGGALLFGSVAFAVLIGLLIAASRA